MTERHCRCEATIPSSILEGYACGNPECWRTAEAKASFEAFVVDLVEKRGGPSGPKQSERGRPAPYSG